MLQCPDGADERPWTSAEKYVLAQELDSTTDEYRDLLQSMVDRAEGELEENSRQQVGRMGIMRKMNSSRRLDG